jgi:hypothetical protein
MPSIKIVTAGGEFTFENDSVENVADLVRLAGPTLGLASGASLAVNGSPATDTTPLADGDEVTATKPAGRKGDRS